MVSCQVVKSHLDEIFAVISRNQSKISNNDSKKNILAKLSYPELCISFVLFVTVCRFVPKQFIPPKLENAGSFSG